MGECLSEYKNACCRCKISDILAKGARQYGPVKNHTRVAAPRSEKWRIINLLDDIWMLLPEVESLGSWCHTTQALDDRYRLFYRGQKTSRWWSVCTTPCGQVCTFNACPSEKTFSVVPGTPELERQ
ncbi:hypothetical protein TNCV_4895091 [Trichonephila clavipes]|nr:hypothetical protein TNCV_4895091 [Trichonephila clavipes]